MLFTCQACSAQFDTLQMDLSRGICPECKARFQGDFSGETVRDYQLIGELARGANGVVYVAQQANLPRDVALKLVLPELCGSAESIDRFFAEARAAAKVAHPNIVQAYSAGVDAKHGVCYFAMEYVDGVTLERQLDYFGAMEFPQALYIGARLAEGLASAWRQVQLVHGDIKPANVLMDKYGEPKLADLGQAHFGREKINGDSLMATPLYVPPELVRGEYDKVGAKTDIYSFGAMLYELFAGEPPFFSLDMDEVLKMQLDDKPEPLREKLGVFDEGLSDLVDSMLAKNPDLRPSSWNEVAEYLHKMELRLQLKK